MPDPNSSPVSTSQAASHDLPGSRTRGNRVPCSKHAILPVFMIVAASCGSGGAGNSSGNQRPLVPGPYDWPTYGHDAQHTFHGRTTLTSETATQLQKAWFFPTGDAVTATPTVVNGTVYVGSWDGYFYAIGLASGKLEWKYKLHPQNGVTPFPGQNPRDSTSDGGLVTASAWYQPGSGSRPDLVIAGGGYTIYAFNAHTGHLYWSHAYTGRPDRPANPSKDNTRIFSSPVVADGLVLFAEDADGSPGYRGYLVAASIDTGNPVWIDQLDLDRRGHVINDGCGNIWSSATILPAADLAVFGVADCGFLNPPPWTESVIAIHISTGTLAWRYRPSRPDPQCDFDFGATANAGIDSHGHATFLGEGSKDGTYYSLNPANGMLRWATNVVFGGFAGGFIGSASYDGHRVYGATAYGDFGRFEGPGMNHCQPHNPRDKELQEPSAHAFDAASGKVVWQQDGAISVAPTTVSGGMTFNGIATSFSIQVREGSDGTLIATLPLSQACWSGIATVGDALVFGLGSSYVAKGSGIEVLTPGGAAPAVPH